MEQIDNPDREEHVLIPELERQVERARAHVPGAEALDVGVEVLWGYNPTDYTVQWVRWNGVDLLVMGTQGGTGLKRILLGSVASSVARQNPCPVLLVPPSFWSGHAHAPGLERVMIATDFHESALNAARWSTQFLAPEAEHHLVHVLDVPEPPEVLASRYGSRKELLRTAREGARQRLKEMRTALSLEPPPSGALPVRATMCEGPPADEIVRLAEATDADLIVMGHRGPSDREVRGWARLGTTVERVLRASPVPVLVARDLPERPPRNLLVAVDGSQPSLRALAWADFLRGRFGGVCTALHVDSLVLFDYADLIPSDALGAEPGKASAATPDPALKAEWVREREAWLRDQVLRAGVDPDTVNLRVEIGKPADLILAEQERIGADLIVMGTHGRGMMGRVLVGSVASAVLRGAPTSVLVMGDARRTPA